MDLCEGGEKMLERLRAMKETSKMTNKDIANATGIPESTINKIFTGVTKDPTLSKVSAIVHCLGYTLDDLSESSPKSAMSEKGKKLFDNFKQLNEKGKSELVRYSGYMLENPDYLKDSKHRTFQTVRKSKKKA